MLLPDHPKQTFLFYIAQEFGEDVPDKVRAFIADLASSRTWIIAPPRFVDEIIDSGVGTLMRTVGGALEIYSALPPLTLPKYIDLAHLQEVEAMVEQVRELSRELSLAIDFELGGVFVGAVEDGHIDEGLREGLLGEWRRKLV